MPFVSYDSLTNICTSDRMKENVRRLERYDVFHCLLAGNPESSKIVSRRIPDLPEAFLKWLEACDGGMLFDTSMLSTKPQDAELDLPFDTYDDYYDIDIRKDINLPDDCFVFAAAIHSDVFFFDMGKKDGQVYQWDVEFQEVYAIWPTFEDWLTEQIDEAIELIADEQLEPLDIKLEAEIIG